MTDTTPINEWQPIETAPKDGTLVRLKRVYSGDIVAEGLGLFGDVTIHYQADGDEPASEQTYRARWVRVDEHGRCLFPEPTHWRPR